MSEQASEALTERGADGLDVTTGLRDAMASLSGPQFNAGKTFARSEHFWDAVEPLKGELLERVRRDAGGTDDAPETLLGTQEAYVEARLFRTSMFLRLVDSGGPITNKGKTRALYTAYITALNIETKLAQVLGLERKAKRVGTVSELLA